MAVRFVSTVRGWVCLLLSCKFFKGCRVAQDLNSNNSNGSQSCFGRGEWSRLSDSSASVLSYSFNRSAIALQTIKFGKVSLLSHETQVTVSAACSSF